MNSTTDKIIAAAVALGITALLIAGVSMAQKPSVGPQRFPHRLRPRHQAQ